MSTSASPIPRRDARRSKFAVYSIVLVVASLVVVGFLNILATRLSVRFDVTAGGDQQLAPRTVNILNGLKGRHEIVIAAPLRTLDGRVVQRLRDTLKDFARQSDQLSSRFIDTSNAGGREQYLDFIKTLIARENVQLDAQATSVRSAIAGTASFAQFLGTTLSVRLLSIRDALTGDAPARAAYREFFQQTAAAARLTSTDLEAAAARATTALESKIDEIPLPATDTAAKDLARVLEPTANELDALIRQLRSALQQTDLPGPLVQQIRTLADDVQTQRDSVAILADTMVRLPRLDVVRVVETLKTASVCLVIGPGAGALTAVDMDSLIPSAATLAQASMSGADIGRRGEDLFSVALASLSGREKPIVVIVHAEPRPVFETTPVVRQLAQRLGVRGIDLVEWAAATQDQPPGLARLNPDSKRPVVYVSVPPNSTAGAGDTQGQLNGPQRAEKLGKVLDQLADDGKNILVGIFPSVAPTTGNVDPTVRVLDRFGIVASSGRTILREIITNQGRLVDSEFELQPKGDGGTNEHAIAKAIHGLPMLLAWPIDLSPIAKEGVTTWPLLSLAPAPGVWSESQWLKFWSLPPEARLRTPDAPAFDRTRDLDRPEVKEGEVARPWMLGYAAQKETKNKPQRLIVIGANGWFIDRYAFRPSPVDGRMVVAYPGNLELFEASVAWLAYHDDMIAQSPAARALPVVKPIGRGVLLASQWIFIAGLPILTLLVGILHRWLRG